MSQSCFGWDPRTKTLTAPDGAWDDLLKIRPKAVLFRNKPFIHHADLDTLCTNTIAKGDNSFNPGKRLARSESDSESAKVDVISISPSGLAPSWVGSSIGDGPQTSAVPTLNVSGRSGVRDPPSRASEASDKNDPSKRRRKTQVGALGDLNSVLTKMVSKIDEPVTPGYVAMPPPPPVPIPTVEDSLALAVKLTRRRISLRRTERSLSRRLLQIRKLRLLGLQWDRDPLVYSGSITDLSVFIRSSLAL